MPADETVINLKLASLATHLKLMTEERKMIQTDDNQLRKMLVDLAGNLKLIAKLTETMLEHLYQTLGNFDDQEAEEELESCSEDFRNGFCEVFQRLYNRFGQRAVEELAQNIGLTNWRFCPGCDSKEPHFEDCCLVCGSYNPTTI